MKLSYDTQDAVDAIRAKRAITDMLRRGYTLLVKADDGRLTRVEAFDETKGEYIIADFDPSGAGEATEPADETTAPTHRGRGRWARRSMESSEAKAIAPSAGG